MVSSAGFDAMLGGGDECGSIAAGASQATIVPLVPTPMAGYPVITPIDQGPTDHRGYEGRTGPHAGVADPVCARVLAISSATQTVLLVSLDVCVVPRSFSGRLRQRIASTFNVSYDAILVAATHNHSGPDFTGHWEPVDPSVPAFVQDQVIAAVERALGERVPAKVGFRSGSLAGPIVNRQDEQRPVDSATPVLRIDGLDGRHIAIVYGYACHPVTVGTHNRLISGEYPGEASRLIESAVPGVTALFVNGGAGDVNPRAFAAASEPNVVARSRALGSGAEGNRIRSITESKRLGALLGSHVLELVRSIDVFHDASLSFARRDVEAELKGRTELDRFLRHMPHSESATAEWRNASVLLTEVISIQVGPLTLLGMPGEPFSETALSLQSRHTHGGRHLRVVGYANDYPGYLPPPSRGGDNRYENIATPLSAKGVDDVLSAAQALAEESHVL